MRHTFSSENVTVHRCFLPIIFSSYLGNRDSMKTGTYEEKFVYYVLLFLSAGTYAKKSSYYVPYRYHSRTFQAPFHPYIPFVLHKGIFLPFFLYMSYFVLLADFLHRGAITSNIDKLSSRQKSSAACYITYAGTLI